MKNIVLLKYLYTNIQYRDHPLENRVHYNYFLFTNNDVPFT